MDLMAGEKVTLSGSYADKFGNLVAAPAGATVTFTVDNPAIIDLTDKGNGTAVVAATGTLGTATLHAEATAPGVPNMTVDLAIVVVAEIIERAERFILVTGKPEKIKPQ